MRSEVTGKYIEVHELTGGKKPRRSHPHGHPVVWSRWTKTKDDEKKKKEEEE